MKKIEKFIADDGSEFDTEKTCQDYEKLIALNQHHLNKMINHTVKDFKDVLAWGVSSFLIGITKSLDKNKKDEAKHQIESIVGKNATFIDDIKKKKQSELRILLNELNNTEQFELSSIVRDEIESRKKK